MITSLCNIFSSTYLDNGWESHKIRLKPVSPISVKIIRSDTSRVSWTSLSRSSITEEPCGMPIPNFTCLGCCDAYITCLFKKRFSLIKKRHVEWEDFLTLRNTDCCVSWGNCTEMQWNGSKVLLCFWHRGHVSELLNCAWNTACTKELLHRRWLAKVSAAKSSSGRPFVLLINLYFRLFAVFKSSCTLSSSQKRNSCASCWEFWRNWAP